MPVTMQLLRRSKPPAVTAWISHMVCVSVQIERMNLHRKLLRSRHVLGQ